MSFCITSFASHVINQLIYLGVESFEIIGIDVTGLVSAFEKALVIVET